MTVPGTLSFIRSSLLHCLLNGIIPINPTLERGQARQMTRGEIVRLAARNFLLVSMRDTWDGFLNPGISGSRDRHQPVRPFCPRCRESFLACLLYLRQLRTDGKIFSNFAEATAEVLRIYTFGTTESSQPRRRF